MSCIRLSLALALVIAPGLAPAQPRGLDARDLVALDRVSAPVLSPDARSVVFAVREADVEANSARTALFAAALHPSDRRGVRRLTPEGWSASSASFAPDGRVVFLSAKEGNNQLWSLSLDGGEPARLSDFALDIGSYRLSPDGNQVAVSFEVYPDCASLACTRERLDANKEKKTTGQHYTQLFVRHWDSWKDGRLAQLFVARFEDGKLGGEPVKLAVGVSGDVPHKPFGGNSDYAWSPDSQQLAVSVRAASADEPWSTNFDIWMVPTRARIAPRNLTAENPAWDADPVFSSDGKTLYYRAMSKPGFEADRFALMALDLASGGRREIAPNWDRSPDGITLSPDGRFIYATTNDLGQRPLFAVEIASGKVQRIAGEGNIGGFDVAGSTVVYARDTLTAPADLFAARLNGKGERRITRFNEARLADVRFGGFEQFSFKGWNEETVHGYVVKPWNYEAGKTYPVAFIIHGGPQGSMGNSFHYRWNPQTYAGAGFAAVFIDFHGSTGYGQAFTDSISQDWGGKPLEDLQKGWAAALAKYPFLDGKRACALGASYGGYMINWIAGNWPDGFACLVNHAGVFDNRSMYYATEELWFPEWEHGGPHFQVPANYEKHNPVNHVANWKTPMLVIHGQRDYRVLVEQGLATFTALQRRGVPSEFLYFPDENHWILKPQNSIQWHDAVKDWLRRWTPGAE
jgi:dipeptidyl aminopeptidase/acylaminoacyl peptidase